jgi:hypothetical protein
VFLYDLFANMQTQSRTFPCYFCSIKWIKNKVATLPLNTSKNEASRQIEIIEMDELYTFFKNEKKRPEFGLLLTETRCVCLHFM